MVERIVHDPESGEAKKPELPRQLRLELELHFRPDTERLEEVAGRSFGWFG